MTSPSSLSSSAVLGVHAIKNTETLPQTRRTAAKKASAKEAALIRNRAGPADNSRRGYTTNQRLRVAGIAQSKALVTIMSNRDRARAKEGVLKILGPRVKRQEGLIASKKFIIPKKTK